MNNYQINMNDRIHDLFTGEMNLVLKSNLLASKEKVSLLTANGRRLLLIFLQVLRQQLEPLGSQKDSPILFLASLMDK